MACDIQCQKDKKLKTLQTIFINASQKAGLDPEAYEQAKIDYFSFRDGPTWLHNYKEQKAEQESEQVVRKYKQKKIDKSINTPEPQEPQKQIIEDDYEFIKKKDNADVEWRLAQINTNWEWLEFGLIVIFSLIIIYQVLTGKLQKIINYFR
jgi:hypothetical protein